MDTISGAPVNRNSTITSAGSRKYGCNCRRGRKDRCPGFRILSRQYKKLRDLQRNRERIRLRKLGPKDMDARIRSAFALRCEYCGQKSELTWTVDRIIPGALGGQYAADNITLACNDCNAKKGARPYVGPVRSLQTMEALRGR
jgi:5-methylcytosine-specific restriction endonuclease McrA